MIKMKKPLLTTNSSVGETETLIPENNDTPSGSSIDVSEVQSIEAPSAVLLYKHFNQKTFQQGKARPFLLKLQMEKRFPKRTETSVLIVKPLFFIFPVM